MRKTGRKPYNPNTPRRPRGRAPTRVDDQVTLATKANTQTPQRNTAEAKTRSRRSDFHADPKAAHRLANGEKRTTGCPAATAANHHSTRLVPPTGGTSKSEAPRGKRHKSAASPDPTRDLGFPPEDPKRRSKSTATKTPSRRTRRRGTLSSSVPSGFRNRAFARQ